MKLHIFNIGSFHKIWDFFTMCVDMFAFMYRNCLDTGRSIKILKELPDRIR